MMTINPRPLWGLAMTLALLVLSSGCSMLSHLDQIMAMSDYSKDKDAQHRMVKQINARYDQLVAAIQSGDIKKYPQQWAIRNAFGDPILIKSVNGQEQWLYRHTIPMKAKDKVWLYFDKEEKLVKYKQEKIEW